MIALEGVLELDRSSKIFKKSRAKFMFILYMDALLPCCLFCVNDFQIEKK